MNKKQAMFHMKNGGQVYRVTDGDRFFYKIEDDNLLCRVNEFGGWNPAISLIKDTDILVVADFDYGFDGPTNLIKIPLPRFDEQGYQALENKERDALKGRVIELETALKWWINERMRDFSDGQYGKGQMRKILNEGSLPIQEG